MDGAWKEQHKGIVEPVLREAFDIATDELLDLGICIQGIVRAKLHRFRHGAKREELRLGCAHDTNDISLWFRRDDFYSRNATWMFHRTVATLAHELVHGERKKYFDWVGTRERAATEGLAYYSDMGVANSIGDVFPSLWDEIASKSGLYWDEQWERFMLETSESSTISDKATYYHWFQSGEKLGNSVGLWAVINKVTEGQEVQDLLAMPANEILRIGV